MYKVTFFMKSGLIHVQGACYRDFSLKDFPILLEMVHKICGPLKSLHATNMVQQHEEEETNPKRIGTNNSDSSSSKMHNFPRKSRNSDRRG